MSKIIFYICFVVFVIIPIALILLYIGSIIFTILFGSKNKEFDESNLSEYDKKMIEITNKTSGIRSSGINITTTLNENNVKICRELPFNDDYFLSYYIARVYNISISKSNIFGAIMTKWTLDGVIKINDKKQIIFLNVPSNDLEASLYRILDNASKNHELTKMEFKKYCNNYSHEMYMWLSAVTAYGRDLIYDTKEYIRDESFIVNGVRYHNYYSSDLLDLKAQQLAGLKLFLKEFKPMDDKDITEYPFWKEYLIYAQMFGCADKLSKKSSDFFSNIDFDTLNYCLDSISTNYYSTKNHNNGIIKNLINAFKKKY